MNTRVKRILAACCLIGILLTAVNYSFVDTFALSLCPAVFVWILFDRRITDLKTRLAILENGETALNASVEVLSQRVDTLHELVDALYETVDKLNSRVEYHSEWCQSLQDMIGAQRRTLD